MAELPSGEREVAALALMQPYFFPYADYFLLLRHAELFVAFDSVKDIKGGWLSRNRILRPDGQIDYIRVPIETHSNFAPISSLRVAQTGQHWTRRLAGQLQAYSRVAPFYGLVSSWLVDLFAQHGDIESLSDLNVALLEGTCHFIGFDPRITSMTALPIAPLSVPAPDEWGLIVCEALGYTRYINAPGGAAWFDRDKYSRSRVELRFIRLPTWSYERGNAAPARDLSILDVLMFKGPEWTLDLLSRYEQV